MIALDRTIVLLVFSGSVLAAQTLDETWTLSINGQSVQVDSDGNYAIPNIANPDQYGPGGPGTLADFVGDWPVRILGVSFEGGTPTYAFGESFRIKQGETYGAYPLVFSPAPPPFPVEYALSLPSASLTFVGEMSQLGVVGTLLDGVTTVDVSANAAVAGYSTSNPDIVSVSGTGLVTAVGAGTAFVSATIEGYTTVLQMDVALGDPLTTIVGVVRFEDGSPAAGVQAKISGSAGTATTDSSGLFSIAGVASGAGPLDVSIVETIAFEVFTAEALDLEPFPGGFTDAGILVLRSECDPTNPSLPGPAHGAVDVPTTTNLTWDPTQVLVPRDWLSVGPAGLLSLVDDELGAVITETYDFSVASLVGVDAVVFSWDALPSFLPDGATKAKLTDFLNQGGALLVEGAGGHIFGDYSWVPTLGVSTHPMTVGSNNIGIADPTHPIAQGVTDEELDDWGFGPAFQDYSSVGDFGSVGSSDIVFVNDDNDRPVFLADDFGIGRAVYSNLRLIDLIQGQNLLKQTMGWLTDASCPPVTFDVYLDSSYPPVQLLCADSRLGICDPGPLVPNKTYFWQVVAKRGSETTAGPIWTFVTGGA